MKGRYKVARVGERHSPEQRLQRKRNLALKAQPLILVMMFGYNNSRT